MSSVPGKAEKDILGYVKVVFILPIAVKPT
jgi:hypothetical protein